MERHTLPHLYRLCVHPEFGERSGRFLPGQQQGMDLEKFSADLTANGKAAKLKALAVFGLGELYVPYDDNYINADFAYIRKGKSFDQTSLSEEHKQRLADMSDPKVLLKLESPAGSFFLSMDITQLWYRPDVHNATCDVGIEEKEEDKVFISSLTAAQMTDLGHMYTSIVWWPTATKFRPLTVTTFMDLVALKPEIIKAIFEKQQEQEDKKAVKAVKRRGKQEDSEQDKKKKKKM